MSFIIISDDLSDPLFQLLGFRHFFIHGYGFMLEEEPLMAIADGVPTLWEKFLEGISGYCEKNKIP